MPAATPTPTPAPIATRLSGPDFGVEVGFKILAEVGTALLALAGEDVVRRALVLALAAEVDVDIPLVILVAVRTV